MRRANSELYIRKAKAEKDCRNMAKKLRKQKSLNSEERATVVARMRMVGERQTAVAVLEATLGLHSDLKKSKRGVESLKYTLQKVRGKTFCKLEKV
jgi:hypothetical protein